MSQLSRDKQAIRAVLEKLGRATFSQIAQQAGEGLWPAMMDMLHKGEAYKSPYDPTPRYQLEPF